MTWQEPTDLELREIINSAKNVAVIGASSDTTKPSFMVFNYLKANTKFNLFPINPKEESVSGVKAYASIKDLPTAIDICVVFRRPEFLPEVLEDVLAVKAKVLWMQLGIKNEYVAEQATDNGIKVIQNRCIKIEHARLIIDSE